MPGRLCRDRPIRGQLGEVPAPEVVVILMGPKEHRGQNPAPGPPGPSDICPTPPSWTHLNWFLLWNRLANAGGFVAQVHSEMSGL